MDLLISIILLIGICFLILKFYVGVEDGDWIKTCQICKKKLIFLSPVMNCRECADKMRAKYMYKIEGNNKDGDSKN